ncbi:MAG: 1-acyl-sn-glycerol-3-phosphate acyltransferase [Planctomycetales bacterium]|nr:1-acyl-sn-glycerol-3-phosphate acyltransferase [Planctomycetales bacterium]MCA9227843.1 1-acyl-sn-glycerol-3-phosphate acyltransferase [Planctomycetales bacterium]
MNRQPYQTPPRWWAPKLSSRWMGVWRPLRRQRGYWMYGLTDVEVRGAEHVRRALDQNQGVLITPNHPTHADPFVLLEAVDQMRQPFFFLTAWQVFAATHRLGRWILRQHGAFSINREGTDVRAMRQAVEVLEKGRCPLVVFPEGEVFHLNDRVTPFRFGAATMALRAARRGHREIACVPCGLRFTYAKDPSEKLSAVMDKLEMQMGWKPRQETSLARRLERLTAGVLYLKELEHFGAGQSGDVQTRIERLIATVLGRLEDRYAVIAGSRTVPERVKQLRQRVIQGSDIAARDRVRLAQFDDDMNQLFFVMQLFSYPADYLQQTPSLERMAETIDKLEEDVLGARSARRRGQRRAIVEFGEPIVVKPAEYTRSDALQLTSEMHRRVQQLLDGVPTAPPLPLPEPLIPALNVLDSPEQTALTPLFDQATASL